jgi:diguanylate cyclase (GGDEF)-like protein/putative nucleotidyltransferase with HDIG domain
MATLVSKRWTLRFALIITISVAIFGSYILIREGQETLTNQQEKMSSIMAGNAIQTNTARWGQQIGLTSTIIPVIRPDTAAKELATQFEVFRTLRPTFKWVGVARADTGQVILRYNITGNGSLAFEDLQKDPVDIEDPNVVRGMGLATLASLTTNESIIVFTKPTMTSDSKTPLILVYTPTSIPEELAGEALGNVPDFAKNADGTIAGAILVGAVEPSDTLFGVTKGTATITSADNTIVTGPPLQNNEIKREIRLGNETWIVHTKRVDSTSFAKILAILIPVIGTATIIMIAGILIRDRRREEQLEEMVEERTRKSELLAKRDPLTGLYNRRELAQQWNQLEEQDSLAVLILDIDHFKSVNDALGHAVGDQVLIGLTELLRKESYGSTILGRWGGEEFVLIVQNVKSENEALRVATRFQQAVAEYPLKTSVGPTPITISIGVTFVEDPSTITLEKAVDNADTGLMGAKSSGRNRARLDTDEQLDMTRQEAQRREQNMLAHNFSVIINAKEGATERHSYNVANLVQEVAKELDLNEYEQHNVFLGGLLHDIGKIMIPDEILAKPGGLSDEEWEIMKTHSVLGSRIAQHIPLLARISPLIEAHHENWDGTGYPHQTSGEEIPIGARIIRVVDSYYAMTESRRYSTTKTQEEALADIKNLTGKHYDPTVTEALLIVLTKPHTPTDS